MKDIYIYIISLTALQLAAIQGALPVVRVLIDAKAELDVVGDFKFVFILFYFILFLSKYTDTTHIFITTSSYLKSECGSSSCTAWSYENCELVG